MALNEQSRLLSDIKRLLQESNRQLCILVDKPQEDPVDPILFCTIVNEECVLTGAQALIRDEETGELVKVYFDANFNPVETPPEGQPCDSTCGDDFDFRQLPPVCYEDDDDNKWQLVVLIQYKNGVEVGRTEIWIGPDGTVTETPPSGLTPCDVDCTPLIQEFDLSENVTSYIPFTNITIYTEGCCDVFVETSAGDFRVRKNIKMFASSQFGCEVELTSITIDPECDPSQVIVYLENKGCSNCNI